MARPDSGRIRIPGNKKGRGETAPTFLIASHTSASTSVVKSIKATPATANIRVFGTLTSNADEPYMGGQCVEFKSGKEMAKNGDPAEHEEYLDSAAKPKAVRRVKGNPV